MRKISIIIPAYNSSATISQCLESVIKQTYKDFECIVINDGSTDLTSSICHSYANNNPQIKIVDSENRGVSSARNLGLGLAQGEYVTFVDSDDCLEPNFLKSFVKENDGADVILSCAYTYVIGKQLSIRDGKLNYQGSLLDSARIINRLYFEGYTNMPWGKFFRLSLIRQFNLCFDSRYQYGEDILFTLDFLKHSECISVKSVPGYNYRLSPNGLSKNKYSYDVILEWNDRLLTKWNQLKEKVDNPNYIDAVIRDNFTFYTYYLQNIIVESFMTREMKLSKLAEVYTRNRNKIKLVRLKGKRALFNYILYKINKPSLTLFLCTKYNF